MPDREATTIEHLIYYQYSKIVAKSAFKVPDGMSAKGKHYGFVKKTFRELSTGVKQWSDITREDWQFVESEEKCIYCGATSNLHKEHIVPKSLSINERCSSCDHIQQIHNQVWACESCNSSKGTMGLYEFFKKQHPTERKYYDLIPKLLEKKYLKTVYNCHRCAGTLGAGDIDGDGELTVLDLDYVLH
jgi:5-methylcytosine-specific restriction endonuclease McrA